MTLIARFQVDGFEPRQVSGLDGDWVGLMTFAKYPREITIVPAVPLTSVGKLDRKKLRQWIAAGGPDGR